MIRLKRGFTLLIAVIFMSVVLALGLALSSLGYKQEVLASSAIESQYAFYAADAGLECGLYANDQQGLFDYASYNPSSPPSLLCDGRAATASNICYNGAACPNRLEVLERVSLDNGTRCADITVSKPANSAGTTYVFSQGYDVSCTVVANPNGARFSSRGIEARF